MEVIHGHRLVAPGGPGSAVAVGIFDGVHRGHRSLLRTALELARRDGLRAVAYTFDPHPAQLLQPSRAPRLLEPLSLRLERLAAEGLDVALVEPFDRELAGMSPEAFVAEALVGALGARHVVVGANFTFGHRQAGDVAALSALGAAHGMQAHGMPLVQAAAPGTDGPGEVSSTAIRLLVEAGDVEGAAARLGHPVRVLGPVVHGAQRGTAFGFPTANLAAENACLPGRGVYAAWAHAAGGATYRAVVNIGHHPTVGTADAIQVEAHLLDYTGAPLYGTRLALDLMARLRDERRFPSVDALRAQIAQDVAHGRGLLQRPLGGGL